MAAHGARRLLPMADNLNLILGVELLCAAQGIGFRAPLATSPALAGVLGELGKHIPPLAEDRYLAPELELAANLVTSGKITAACGLELPALWD